MKTYYEESKPIVVADKHPKEYVWVILKEMQHHNYAILHAIDKYMGNVEVIVGVLSVVGIYEKERENNVMTLNIKNNSQIRVNQVVLEKIAPLRE